MKKSMRIILTSILALMVVASSMLLMTIKLINPNDFKDKVSHLIYAKTGRELTINGNIEWSLFPWLGVKVNDVALENGPTFKRTNFAKIGELGIKLKTWPLIFRRIEGDKMILTDLTIQLMRNERGENNWDDLLDAAKKSSMEEKAAAVFALSNVEIKNANIALDDRQNQYKAAITDLHVHSKDVNTNGVPFSVVIHSNFHNSEPNVSGNMNFTSNITIDFKKQYYAVKDLKVTGSLLGDPLVEQTPFDFSGDVVADLEKQNLNIYNLRLKLASLLALGKIQASNVIYAPNVTGELAAVPFDPKPLLRSLGVLSENEVLPPGTLQSAAFKVDLHTSSKFLKIPVLELRLDDSILMGQANYSHFNDKDVIFNIDINRLNLDRYLALQEHLQELPKGGIALLKMKFLKHKKMRVEKEIGHESSSSFFADLRQVRLNGDLHIGDFMFSKVHFKNIDAQVNGDYGIINLNPLAFSFYQGGAHGGIHLDIRKDKPKVALSLGIVGASVQPLFQDMANTNKIAGLATVNIRLNTIGNTSALLLNNLGGNGNVILTNGVFYGVDIPYQIARASALLQKQAPVGGESQPSRTFFGRLTGTFKIKDGVLRSNDLAVHAPTFQIVGQGLVSLSKQMVNFVVNALDKKSHLLVPIRVGGSFSALTFTPDFSVITGKFLENTLNNAVDKQGVIKIKGKDAEKIEKGLRKFLGL